MIFIYVYLDQIREDLPLYIVGLLTLGYFSIEG